MPFITDLISKVTNLRIKIGDKLNILKSQIGQLNSLTTDDKTSLVGAVNEVNNIEIGGRNLVLNSKNDKIIYNATTNENYIHYDLSDGKLEPNTEYTLTWEYATSSNFLPSRVFFLSDSGEHKNTDWILGTNNIRVKKTWIFTTGSNPNQNGRLRFDHKGSTNGENCMLSVCLVKLEKGNKATDWTPAPEDQVSNWAETDSNNLSFIKGKEIVSNEFNNVYDQISSRANNRLSNLASDLTADEKGTIRDKIGVVLPTVNDGNLTLSTGTGLSGSANFTANQAGGSTFSVDVANTHKLPTTAEWNALPTTNTITRLRGTVSGTYTSGDLTLLAGANTTITQSGANITIASTDTITAQAFYESSLRKYKTNIKPYEESALEVINSLDIVTFDRNDSNIKNKIGIIADDSPSEILNEDHDAVDLYKTVFVLTKAVQELNAKIKELEKQK